MISLFCSGSRHAFTHVLVDVLEVFPVSDYPPCQPCSQKKSNCLNVMAFPSVFCSEVQKNANYKVPVFFHLFDEIFEV